MANIDVEKGIRDTLLDHTTDIPHPWAPQKKCSMIFIIIGIVVAIVSVVLVFFFWNEPDALLQILFGAVGLPIAILSTSAGAIFLVRHYYPPHTRNITNCFGCCW